MTNYEPVIYFIGNLPCLLELMRDNLAVQGLFLSWYRPTGLSNMSSNSRIVRYWSINTTIIVSSIKSSTTLTDVNMPVLLYILTQKKESYNLMTNFIYYDFSAAHKACPKPPLPGSQTPKCWIPQAKNPCTVRHSDNTDNNLFGEDGVRVWQNTDPQLTLTLVPWLSSHN